MEQIENKNTALKITNSMLFILTVSTMILLAGFIFFYNESFISVHKVLKVPLPLPTKLCAAIPMWAWLSFILATISMMTFIGLFIKDLKLLLLLNATFLLFALMLALAYTVAMYMPIIKMEQALKTHQSQPLETNK